MDRHIFGLCRTAATVDSGKLQSTTPATEWHRRCRGGTIDAQGRTQLCGCVCHLDQPRCIECGASDVELDDSRRCLDEAGCAGRIRDALLGNQRYQEHQRYQAESRAERASRAAERVRPQATGRCEHCGEPTAGGRFLPGHDAKLKGDLIRAALDSDIHALAELHARGWLKAAERWSDAEHRAAEQIVQATPTDQLLEQRNQGRWGQ